MNSTTYENGQYTERIHNMNADQVWNAWKNQHLTVGQVSTWQSRHNYFFNLDPSGDPKHTFNLVVYTENEKYNAIRLIRKIGASLDDVAGYGAGYYIQFTADDGQAAWINNRLHGGAAV